MLLSVNGFQIKKWRMPIQIWSKLVWKTFEFIIKTKSKVQLMRDCLFLTAVVNWKKSSRKRLAHAECQYFSTKFSCGSVSVNIPSALDLVRFNLILLSHDSLGNIWSRSWKDVRNTVVQAYHGRMSIDGNWSLWIFYRWHQFPLIIIDEIYTCPKINQNAAFFYSTIILDITLT